MALHHGHHRNDHRSPSRELSAAKRAAIWITLAAFIWQPMLASAAAAGIVADPNAGVHRPVVDAAPNGVPLVQITAPSAAGVSHNQYQDYNVDSRGAILNNSAGISNTQLG